VARTLTAATTTEKNKVTGAFPRWILEIQFGGATGNKYYAEELLHGPVPCEGRVVNWGQLQLSAEPGKIGGFDQLTITMEDSDRELRSLFESFPGVQNKLAYVYLWFEGTDWELDRITLFAGVLSAPLSWNDRDTNWSISMKGLQEYFDKSVGRLIKQEDFSEVNCTECDGKAIPIIYGNPCRRVPVCIIDRPGEGFTAYEIGPHETQIQIHDEAAKLYFTTGSTIQLVVGYPGNYETFSGSFSSAASTFFDIDSRSSILASGNLSGVFAEEGDRFALINSSSMDVPSIERGGHPVWFNNGDGWRAMMITHWTYEGSQIVLCKEPPDFTFSSSTEFKIGALPGIIPYWSAGTPVYEYGTYKYLLNFLPSKSVELLEAKGVSNSAGGGEQREIFMTYNPALYSVNLNDQSFNSVLGRESGDPGVTTATVNSTPAQSGFNDANIYATLKGIMNDSDDVIEDPADVIKHLLTNPFLGNIGSDFIDSDSFTDTAGNVVTKMAFAIQEEKKLNELVSNLAQQANSLLFWDGGKATLKYIETRFTSHQAALTPSNVRMDSINLELTPDKNLPTEMVAKFKQAITSPEQRLSRTSDEAIANFKEKREEVDLWAFQLPTSVAKATENWLAYKLLINQIVKVNTFLNGLHLQPGDVVILNYADGNGGLVFDGKYGRIRSIRHSAGSSQQNTMEEVQLLIETNLWPFTINTAVPLDSQCAQPVGSPTTANRGEVPWPTEITPVTTADPTTTGGPTTTEAGTTPSPTGFQCALPVTAGFEPEPGSGWTVDFSTFDFTGCLPEAHASILGAVLTVPVNEYTSWDNLDEPNGTIKRITWYERFRDEDDVIIGALLVEVYCHNSGHGGSIRIQLATFNTFPDSGITINGQRPIRSDEVYQAWTITLAGSTNEDCADYPGTVDVAPLS